MNKKMKNFLEKLFQQDRTGDQGIDGISAILFDFIFQSRNQTITKQSISYELKKYDRLDLNSWLVSLSLFYKEELSTTRIILRYLFLALPLIIFMFLFKSYQGASLRPPMAATLSVKCT